jgi:hypothetical protein
MARFTQNLVLVLCGALTSAITAGFLVFIELKWGFAFYSWTLWLIIPAGAGLAGFVASSGYYFGARLFNIRPARDLLLGVVVISVGTFFFIYWLEYMFLTVDGKAISDVISYSDYLTFSITHTSLNFGYRGHFIDTPVNIGAGGGYLYAAIQIIGFALGGVCIYLYLASLPFCKECSLYLKHKGQQTRYFGTSEEVQASIEGFLAMASGRRFQDSINGHAVTGPEKSTGTVSAFSSTIEVKRCEGCEKHWLKFGVKRWDSNKKEWKEISDFNYAQFMMERVEVAKN